MKNIILKNTAGEELYPVTSASLVAYQDSNVEQALATKQDTLVSGENIKTVNGNSLLGGGNIEISTGGTITVDSALSTTSENPVQNKVITTTLNGKQDNLVSGTTIKTINGESLLGSGNITITSSETPSWNDITDKPENLVTNVTISSTGNAVTNAQFSDGVLTLTMGTISSGGLSPEQEEKLNGIAENATKVSFESKLSSGTNIGTININGTDTQLYAPSNADTTYQFTSGNGSFTVTPSDGEPQVISIGKPNSAGSADTLAGLTVNVTDLNTITSKSEVAVSGELPNSNALTIGTITVDEEDHVLKVPYAGTSSRIAGLWQPSTPSTQPRVAGQLVYYAVTSGSVSSASSSTGEATACVPVATASRPGVIKVGSGLEVTSDGTLSATGGGTEYNLPTASNSTLGGVKTGWAGIAGQGYPINISGSGQIYLPVDLIAVQNVTATASGNNIVLSINRPTSGSIQGGQACQWTIPASVIQTVIQNSAVLDNTYLKKNVNETTTGTFTAKTFYESSDKNLKENIDEISIDKQILSDNITFKQFTFKNNDTQKYGVIAQEIEDIGLNNLVSTDTNNYKSVDYISLLCLKVARLESKLNELLRKEE